MKKVLVTGASGLLGNRVCYDLLNSGEYEVYGLSRTAKPKGYLQDVYAFYGNASLADKIHWLVGEIEDVFSLNDVMQDFDLVVHAAAMVSFHPKDTRSLEKANKYGTRNVVNACLDHQVKSLVYVSSVASIGGKEGELATEEKEWNETDHKSNYGISKYEGELEVFRGIEEGLSAVIVNPATILGASNQKQSSASLYLTLKNGLPFYTSGGNCFVDVRDVSKLIIRLASDDVVGERYILSSNFILFKDLFSKIAESLGVSAPKREATDTILKLGGVVQKVIELFGGKRASINKEMIRTSQEKKEFSNQKVLSKYPDFRFIPVDESIAHFGEFYKG